LLSVVAKLNNISQYYCCLLNIFPLQDNLDSVESLLKKHEDFEKSLDAQEERMKALDQVAKKLMSAGHYATVDIASRRDAVLQR
jgi:hypothetical protein